MRQVQPPTGRQTLSLLMSLENNFFFCKPELYSLEPVSKTSFSSAMLAYAHLVVRRQQ
jgi:hypothetical protein